MTPDPSRQEPASSASVSTEGEGVSTSDPRVEAATRFVEDRWGHTDGAARDHAVDFLAALDAVSAPSREKVAEAIAAEQRLRREGRRNGQASSLQLADAAIAAMRSGAPPTSTGEALPDGRGFRGAGIPVSSQCQPMGLSGVVDRIMPTVYASYQESLDAGRGPFALEDAVARALYEAARTGEPLASQSTEADREQVGAPQQAMTEAQRLSVQQDDASPIPIDDEDGVEALPAARGFTDGDAIRYVDRAIQALESGGAGTDWALRELRLLWGRLARERHLAEAPGLAVGEGERDGSVRITAAQRAGLARAQGLAEAIRDMPDGWIGAPGKVAGEIVGLLEPLRAFLAEAPPEEDKR